MMQLQLGLLAILALTGAAANEQDLPMVDGVGSYTHSQIMRHPDDETGRKSKGIDRRRTAGRDAGAKAEMRAKMAELEPEYRRRIRVHGKASADRWLKSTAYAMGQRDGARARRRQR